MSDHASNPYAPPRAEVHDPAPSHDGTLPLAGRWRRLGGSLIDVVIAMAALWVVSLVTPWDPFDPAKADWMRFALVDGVLGFALFLLIQGFPLATSAQTWGKKALGMRIVRPDGSKPDFARLVGLRYGVTSLFNLVPAAGQVWGVVNALFIFRASRRCLHDSIADTLVVKL